MLKDEILLAKGKNWAKLVADRADLLAEQRKDEDDAFIQLLSGQIFDEAVNQIALEIKAGLYDKMLIPIEYNKYTMEDLILRFHRSRETIRVMLYRYDIRAIRKNKTAYYDISKEKYKKIKYFLNYRKEYL